MRVGEVYPSRFIAPEDLDSGTVTIVEIADVKAEDVRDFKGPPDAKKKALVLYLAGFEKGLCLNSTNVKMVMRILGSDESRDWIGKQIQIYPDMFKGRDGDTPTIKVSRKLPPPKPEPKKLELGAKGAQRFTAAVKSRGGSFADFLAWLKRTDRPAHDKTIGTELEHIPADVVPFMQRYIEALGAPRNPDATPAHTRNAMGDPVLPPGSVDDDIPF